MALEKLRSEPPTPSKSEPKPEKSKPVRISKIAEINADLELGRVHRFVLTAAQDDTPVFEPFFNNLLAYAADIGASLLVAGFTYQKGLFEDHAAATAVFAPQVREYLVYDRVRLSDSMMFVADANVLPTTARPLTGWTTANGGQHVVIPHARIALQSIPRPMCDAPRFAVSTGCCTLPSYAPRAAGRKSIARHTYAALLVEIDTDGEIFFRHLVGNKTDGSFQDLDVFVTGGHVLGGATVSTIAWGDIHYEMLDPVVAMTAFGFCVGQKRTVSTDSIYERLRPEFCFYHDGIDFRRRNHHNIADPHLMAEVYASGRDSVEDEVCDAANFINAMRRDWCVSVMVESNHDSAICRWAKDQRGQTDPANSYYWHELNAAWHQAIRRRDRDFNLVEHAMRAAGLADDVEFIASGSSFVVRDVEYGFHGDYGVSGAKGSPRQFTRVGRKMTTEHTHAPSIEEDVYTGGLSAKYDQGYNRKGMLTWAFAHVVGYHNGTRIILMQSADGRYRAAGDGQAPRIAA
ncbi:hypothetical protein GHL01_00325 [Sinorhizobium meliloti]|uniref:hypothetical protein n=1 Tax=Rhizobium meliloti TaxID=382 RepID=UPI0012962324|nr:hypothetical protein [Sinorhizobium meliloti]MQV12190.1 hypothetical protein [Sinorhizobium meliloti]